MMDNHYKSYTMSELVTLAELHDKCKISYIAKKLGRTERAIYAKIREMKETGMMEAICTDDEEPEI